MFSKLVKMCQNVPKCPKSREEARKGLLRTLRIRSSKWPLVKITKGQVPLSGRGNVREVRPGHRSPEGGREGGRGGGEGGREGEREGEKGSAFLVH